MCSQQCTWSVSFVQGQQVFENPLTYRHDCQRGWMNKRHLYPASLVIWPALIASAFKTQDIHTSTAHPTMTHQQLALSAVRCTSWHLSLWGAICLSQASTISTTRPDQPAMAIPIAITPLLHRNITQDTLPQVANPLPDSDNVVKRVTGLAAAPKIRWWHTMA